MSICSIRNIVLVFGFSLMSLSSCIKEEIHVYEINEVELYSSASEKENLKTDEQFLSILYTDLFERSISNQQMERLYETYSSIGDKSLAVDMITKSLITSNSAKIPSDAEMRGDPKAFVEQAFKKFYVRKPTEQEVWFLKNQIEKNDELTAVDIYYAMLTADEYRYY